MAYSVRPEHIGKLTNKQTNNTVWQLVLIHCKFILVLDLVNIGKGPETCSCEHGQAYLSSNKDEGLFD